MIEPYQLDYSLARRRINNPGLSSGDIITTVNITLVVSVVLPLLLYFSTSNSYWWHMIQISPAIFFTLLILHNRYGHMTNWWSIFVGHDIKVNRQKIAEREAVGESSDRIRKEIAEWAGNCCRGSWVIVNPYHYRFMKKGDASFFKLAWG